MYESRQRLIGTLSLIILDTNVVSDIILPVPNPSVACWVAEQVETDLFVTAVTEAELRSGIELLPLGHRRTTLETRITQILNDAFQGRILPFDGYAARVYAKLRATRRKAGMTYVIEDCMIAGIALSIGAAVATRNVRDFEGCGIDLINPWHSTPE